MPPHVVELAVERSGGSPEFLLDLLAAAAAGDRDELPESVGAATMARIDALDPRDGAVVRRAAVLGINFHPRRLADVLEGRDAAPRGGFLGPPVRRVRAGARRPRALQAPGDPGGRLFEPSVQAAPPSCTCRSGCGWSTTETGARRRSGDPVAPLLAGRRPRPAHTVRDGGGQARHRRVLARRRGEALSAGDRGGARGGRRRRWRARWRRPGSSSARRCAQRASPPRPRTLTPRPAGCSATTRSRKRGCATGMPRSPIASEAMTSASGG